MRVKKTNSGKIRLELDRDEREALFSTLVNFLETESVNIMSVRFRTLEDVTRHLHYIILNDLLASKDFRLHIKDVMKMSVTRAEAIALMWHLRFSQEMHLLLLKSNIHKILS